MACPLLHQVVELVFMPSNLPMTGWYTADKDGMVHVRIDVCVHHTVGLAVPLDYIVLKADTLALEALYQYTVYICHCFALAFFDIHLIHFP